jgi:adenine deaminase
MPGIENGIIEGQVVDVFNRTVRHGRVVVDDGRILRIEPLEKSARIRQNNSSMFILPGFTDAHIHIESSMLLPYEFARRALIHGTVATVSDPHEIANVCGLEGVRFMLQNARDARLKIHFGAPSCVPATSFETAGAWLSPEDVEVLLQMPEIPYLSEMMNYPGVLHGDPEVMRKIAIAKKYGKPVDGHAPGLTGDEAVRYIRAGISTDHECFTYEEALHKVKHGMKILIREGSAARNFEALHRLISEFPDQVMLCSDDKHPDELMKGHINEIVKRALANGHNLFDVLQAACVNPVLHYNLPVGLLRPGDPADFIVVDDLEKLNVLATYINGEAVAANGTCVLPPREHISINHFSVHPKSPDDFAVQATGTKLRVIEAIDGQLITRQLEAETKTEHGFAVADPEHDILKLTVVNRYRDVPPAVAFILNFNLKRGAIASTVAHDSHNIIAVGADDDSLCRAVNLLVANKGGLSVVDGDHENVLPLPVAGLMSDLDCDTIGGAYSQLDKQAKKMGCTLRAPFMTLSFMALLVIPRLKLSDKGLFDGERFCFVGLFAHDD